MKVNIFRPHFFLTALILLSISCTGRQTDSSASDSRDIPPPVSGQPETDQRLQTEFSGFSATRGLTPLEVDSETFRRVSVSAGEEFKTASDDAGGLSWLLSVKLAADRKTPVLQGRVTLSSPEGGKNRSFSFNAAPPEQTLYFNAGSAGFFPAEIAVTIEEPGRIAAIYLVPDSLSSENLNEKITPVPADPGIILIYDQTAWRNEEYELFSWSVLPEILLFDFKDYRIQRKYFTRLAYFVGVAGERGRVEEESYYEGRHVFNAHDYRPEDMAAFYLKAEEKGLSLNREEEILKQIALNNGILKIKNRKISPGAGAILSFSRETPAWLRRRLLAHEAMHGLFYISEEFRKGCFDLWDAITQEEQSYWTLFLANKGKLDNRTGYTGYAVDSHYLLVNEILGHMMQLNRNEVNSYFLDIYLGRLEKMFPDKQALFTEIRKNQSGMFMKTRMSMEKLMYDIFSFQNGNIFSVSPLSL